MGVLSGAFAMAVFVGRCIIFCLVVCFTWLGLQSLQSDIEMLQDENRKQRELVARNAGLVREASKQRELCKREAARAGRREAAPRWPPEAKLNAPGFAKRQFQERWELPGEVPAKLEAFVGLISKDFIASWCEPGGAGTARRDLFPPLTACKRPPLCSARAAALRDARPAPARYDGLSNDSTFMHVTDRIIVSARSVTRSAALPRRAPGHQLRCGDRGSDGTRRHVPARHATAT